MCFGASVLLRKASALKRIDVRYGPQNATEGRNIFITGATGSGKTYLACAFGMEALKQYFSVKFVRLPDMLLALETAREEKNYPKVLSKFIRPALLIIDEWLLMKVRPEDVNYIFETSKNQLISCGKDGFILIWELNKPENPIKIKAHENDNNISKINRLHLKSSGY